MELEQIERVIENAGLYTYLGKIDLSLIHI